MKGSGVAHDDKDNEDEIPLDILQYLFLYFVFGTDFDFNHCVVLDEHVV